MIGKVTAEKGKFIEEHCDYKNADELDNWLHSREHFIDSYMVDQIRTEEKFRNGSQD